MKIIGLLGPAGSGKSTIAEHLVGKYGAVRRAFATPLKQIVQRAFDLTDDQLYGSQEEKERIDPRYNVSARWLMQRIGTEGFRSVLGRDFWWSYCLKQIFDEGHDVVVIDDVRFPNEAAGLLQFNKDRDPRFLPIRVWRIESPVEPGVVADPNHESEATWKECEYTDLIKPAEPGLVELYDAVDEAAYNSGLTVVQSVLS